MNPSRLVCTLRYQVTLNGSVSTGFGVPLTAQNAWRFPLIRCPGRPRRPYDNRHAQKQAEE